MSNYPPIYFDWVERDADNVDLVFRGSRVTLFRIPKDTRQWVDFWAEKVPIYDQKPAHQSR